MRRFKILMSTHFQRRRRRIAAALRSACTHMDMGHAHIHTRTMRVHMCLMLSVRKPPENCFNAGILNNWCYFVDITIHLAMITMLLDFKSSVYGLAGAYFEF